jgi:hypothetical protein
MKITIKIFMPLEVQPEAVYGAEDWLFWQNDVYLDSLFGDYLTDNGESPSLGAIWISNGNVTTADTFTIKVGEVETVYVITDYKVICQDGVWGWLTEAEEAQL